MRKNAFSSSGTRQYLGELHGEVDADTTFIQGFKPHPLMCTTPLAFRRVNRATPWHMSQEIGTGIRKAAGARELACRDFRVAWEWRRIKDAGGLDAGQWAGGFPGSYMAKRW